MAIVTSQIVEDSPQIDGSRWIRERHLDNIGVEHLVQYLAPNAAWDANATLAARSPQIAADLTNTEIKNNLTSVSNDAAPTLSFNYSTTDDLNAALRDAYAMATQVSAVLIGAYLDAMTDVQLATLFGYANPSSQMTALRSALDQQAQMKTAGSAAKGQ